MRCEIRLHLRQGFIQNGLIDFGKTLCQIFAVNTILSRKTGPHFMANPISVLL